MEKVLINDARLERLNSVLLEIAPDHRIAVAFSGGLDSRFLAFAAKTLGFEVFLFHVRGPHISAEESSEAEQWAQEHGFSLKVVEINPLEIDEVRFNRKDRCYFCKKGLFTRLLREVGSLPLCDGTNHSDLSHYRPGLKALHELRVRSPLAEAGMSKKDNREVGSLIGLDHCDQAGRPCLLTRFPYDQEADPRELIALARAEADLARYFESLDKGEIHFRLRKVGPKRFELHILNNDYELLSPTEIKKAVQLLSEHPEVEPDEWVPMENLSGFFDRAH